MSLLAEDIDAVTKEDVLINDYCLRVRVRCFLGDSPARSEVKCNFLLNSNCNHAIFLLETFISSIVVVYFNHKYGCQKCCVVGVHDKDARRVHFHQFDQPGRTDSSFRNRLCPNHHKGMSPFEELTDRDGSPLLDMVKQFPTSDSLHLLEVGVMKKKLKMWMKGTSVYRK